MPPVRRLPVQPRAQSLDELGVAAGLDQSSLKKNHLHAIELAIVDADLHDLVIIGAVNPVKTGNVYARRYPHARIHVLSFHSLPPQAPGWARDNVVLHKCNGISGAHNYLTTVAHPQVLIDSCARAELKTESLRELLFHLPDGGLYAIENLADTGVRQAVLQLQAIAADGRPPDASEFELALARAIGAVEHHRNFIHICKRGDHLLKLRDGRADAVLSARKPGSWGETLDRLPAQTVRSRATVWANGPVDTFTPVMQVPELYLREYRDVVCAPRQLAVLDDIVLPISFHHRLHRSILSRSLAQHDASRRFVTVDDTIRTAPHLPGTYYHLDSEYPWHFGHFMTEDISRLWGWRPAKRRHPELKALISTWNLETQTPGDGPTRHQRTVFAAYGIAAEDLVCIDAPVRVDLLVGASQLLYNPRHARYVHPTLAGIWDELRDSLRTPPSQRADAAPRLFVSRGGELNRACRNADEVEALFESYGYLTVRPETLDIRGQVDLFAGAEVVAGFGGSAMFNAVYCEQPGTRIILAPVGYGARNEYLISALRGDDYHHFFCPAEIEHVAGRWSQEAFMSPYEFDFARDGPALERLLRD